MPAPITRELVWNEIERRHFAVLSYVTPASEARSAGIVYVVINHKLYIRVAADSWKAKHIRLNSKVALNVTIHKSVPLMPWIKIPQATIAFKGTAAVIEAAGADEQLLSALRTATGHDGPDLAELSVLEVTPAGHFLTYGVGVSLLDMRDPEKARGRVAVD